ncbi:MAG: response regulator [Candidatus Melainabacteria bacterium]
MSQDLKALVVDDSAIMRKVIISSLVNTLGFDANNIQQAEDGLQALEAVKDPARTFDIILMDWNMPNMLGIDAVREIRALGDKTPILMVTTEGERTNVVIAIQAGANNYLVKPFNAEDLRVKIEQLLTINAG